MIVLFWSEWKGCGITSNMEAVAAQIAMQHHKKCVLVQTKRRNNDISASFFEPQKGAYLREACDYFFAEGLDYLMMQKEMKAEQVLQSLKEVLPHQLYYLPPGGRERFEHATKQAGKMKQILEQLDALFDFVFVDAGFGENELITEFMRKADYIVINFTQDAHRLDSFFEKAYDTSKKFYYLIGAYQPQSVYNQKNIQRIYRIPKEKMGVVPYNPKFQFACEKGHLLHYVGEQRKAFLHERDSSFFREIDAVSNYFLGEVERGKTNVNLS